MNAISHPIVPSAGVDEARLRFPMQEIMARVLRDATDEALTQLMFIGVARKVGTTFVAQQAASHLAAAFGSVLVIEVSANVDDSEMLAGDLKRLRVPNHSVVRISLSVNSCLKLLGHGGESPTKLAERLREHFDLVLWDMPSPTFAPVSIVAARHMNSIVLVAQANKSRRHAAKYVCDRLEDSGGNVLGVVLNRTLNFIPEWLYRWL